MLFLAQNCEADEKANDCKDESEQVSPAMEADVNASPAEGMVVMRRPEPMNISMCAPPPPPATQLPTHRGFLLAARILTSVAGLCSIVSIVVAALVLHYCATTESEEEGESLVHTIATICYGLMMAESCLCFVAMVTCFALLFSKPHKVLIRRPQDGSFFCLCVSVFLLFLFAIVSIFIQATWRDYDTDPGTQGGLYVIHTVRAIALLLFLAELYMYSEETMHDEMIE